METEMLNNQLFGTIDSVTGSPGIRPYLRIRTDVTYKNSPVPPPVIDVINVSGTASLYFARDGRLTNDASIHLGALIIPTQYGTLVGNGNSTVLDCILELEHPLLHAIEQLRKHKDVILRLDIGIVAAERASGSDLTPKRMCFGQITRPGYQYCHYEIPKSKWLEILKDLGYGEFHLAEIPLPQIKKVKALDACLRHVQRAWEHFLDGSDREAMAACHDAFEWIAKHYVNPNSKPDQNAFTNILSGTAHPEKVKAISQVLARCADLTQLGRHEHKPSVELEHRDAEFAILLTHASVAYFSRTSAVGRAKSRKAGLVTSV
jgi:hypothetical protein